MMHESHDIANVTPEDEILVCHSHTGARALGEGILNDYGSILGTWQSDWHPC